MANNSSNSKLFSELFTSLTQAVIQNRSLDDLELTRLQMVALQTINKHAGITMSQLSALLGIKKSQLTGIVNVLEKRGLAQREHNPENRRVVNVQRTDKGQAVIAKNVRLIEARTSAGLNTLDEVEQQSLIKHLQISIDLMNKAGIIHADGADHHQ